MFYYLLSPLLTYNYILVIAAVVPAVFLMLKAYRSDRLEPESPALLWRVIIAGVLSSLIALVLEKIGYVILDAVNPSDETTYNVILYFVIVAFSEEGAKYFMLRRRTWNHPEFNCQYDGVLYALFVSLGFALWENISYVLQYGFSTALIRAFTAIPGHACFGIFMGVFYGRAKKASNQGDGALATLFTVLSIVVPALLHGAYDFIASMDSVRSGWYFLIFIAVMFVLSFLLIKKESRNDQYI